MFKKNIYEYLRYIIQIFIPFFKKIFGVLNLKIIILKKYRMLFFVLFCFLIDFQHLLRMTA